MLIRSDDATRPRYFSHDGGYVFILRSINYNSGYDPEDMISIRIWVSPEKMLILLRRQSKSVLKLFEKIENSNGPKSIFEALIMIVEQITDYVFDFAVNTSEQATDLEEEEILNVSNIDEVEMRQKISDLRKIIITFRRYINPQRDVFQSALLDKSIPFSNTQRMELREVSNKTIKSIEDIDYARDQLNVLQDELQSKMGISMSKIMYLISLVTVIFLPLSLITSLLGANVNGIPYADSPHAFWWVCLVLSLLVIILIFVMKAIRWLK